MESCIMSGCDYMPSIKGFGIKSIINLYSRLGNTERVILKLRFDKKS